MLPAVGFGLLMKYIISENSEILYFLFGFILIAVFEISIIPVTIIALFFAYLDINIVKGRRCNV